MDARVTHRTLQFFCKVQCLCSQVIATGQGPQALGFFIILTMVGGFDECLIPGKQELQGFGVWRCLGQSICLVKGQFQCPRSIFDGRFCCHAAIGNDLRHLA